MDQIKKMSAGHDFLKLLGRTKLRPGGGIVTKWLLSQVSINEYSKVLEVACNQGDNLISIYNDSKCEIKGIDIDLEVVEKCVDNLKILGLEDKIDVVQMDAKNLKFNDQSFDLVLNEAMLTMLQDEDKRLALKEYYRVLKPEGKLIIHDVSIDKDDEELIKKVSVMANINAKPLTKFGWVELLEECGFEVEAEKHGKFLLLDKETIIRDEGPMRAIEFYKNASKDEFKERIDTMTKRSSNGDMNYIGIIAKKGN